MSVAFMVGGKRLYTPEVTHNKTQKKLVSLNGALLLLGYLESAYSVQNQPSIYRENVLSAARLPIE